MNIFPVLHIYSEDEMTMEKCEMCGTTKNVKYMIDPFVQDIYNGKEEWRYLCKRCYLMLCDEV